MNSFFFLLLSNLVEVSSEATHYDHPDIRCMAGQVLTAGRGRAPRIGGLVRASAASKEDFEEFSDSRWKVCT